MWAKVGTITFLELLAAKKYNMELNELRKTLESLEHLENYDDQTIEGISVFEAISDTKKWEHIPENLGKERLKLQRLKELTRFRSWLQPLSWRCQSKRYVWLFIRTCYSWPTHQWAGSLRDLRPPYLLDPRSWGSSWPLRRAIAPYHHRGGQLDRRIRRAKDLPCRTPRRGSIRSDIRAGFPAALSSWQPIKWIPLPWKGRCNRIPEALYKVMPAQRQHWLQAEHNEGEETPIVKIVPHRLPCANEGFGKHSRGTASFGLLDSCPWQ